MKKLSSILESQANQKTLASITTVDAFNNFLHEELAKTKDYDKDTANQLAESILSENRQNIQESLISFTAFMQNI